MYPNTIRLPSIIYTKELSNMNVSRDKVTNEPIENEKKKKKKEKELKNLHQVTTVRGGRCGHVAYTNHGVPIDDLQDMAFFRQASPMAFPFRSNAAN